MTNRAPNEAPPYGVVESLSPMVRRILAPNPSPFTGPGTGTFILGHGQVAVIDPGPADPRHVEAIATALAGEEVAFYAVTHTHRDHSPAAALLQRRLGGRIAGCAPLALAADAAGAEAAFDSDYRPDRVLADGESIRGPGWSLRAVATPGHTSNHLCFSFPEEETLFSGDHVMGWSTTVVIPPDGDMAAYLDSLRKLLPRPERLYRPTHGAAIAQPERLMRAMIAHRQQREAQILHFLREAPATIPALVQRMYAQVNQRLWGAAGESVLAHLIDLERRQLVRRDGALWQRTPRSE